MCVCSTPNYHLFAEPSSRGKGLGLEATQLMMYYGKETIAGMSIVCHCNPIVHVIRELYACCLWNVKHEHMSRIDLQFPSHLELPEEMY